MVTILCMSNLLVGRKSLSITRLLLLSANIGTLVDSYAAKSRRHSIKSVPSCGRIGTPIVP